MADRRAARRGGFHGIGPPAGLQPGFGPVRDMAAGIHAVAAEIAPVPASDVAAAAGQGLPVRPRAEGDRLAAGHGIELGAQHQALRPPFGRPKPQAVFSGLEQPRHIIGHGERAVACIRNRRHQHIVTRLDPVHMQFKIGRRMDCHQRRFRHRFERKLAAEPRSRNPDRQRRNPQHLEIHGARHVRLAVPGVFHHQFLDDVRSRVAAQFVEFDLEGQPLFLHHPLHHRRDIHRHLAVQRAVDRLGNLHHRRIHRGVRRRGDPFCRPVFRFQLAHAPPGGGAPWRCLALFVPDAHFPMDPLGGGQRPALVGDADACSGNHLAAVPQVAGVAGQSVER